MPEYPIRPQQHEEEPLEPTQQVFNPVAFEPYPNYTSPEYLAEYYPKHDCYLDSAKTTPAPKIFAFEGIPQGQAEPLIGSYSTLGLREDVCFDRFGRFGPYGFGYNETEGGAGVGLDVERSGSEQVWEQIGGRIDYRAVDWSKAQDRCYEANKLRFEGANQTDLQSRGFSKALKTIPRKAVVIRTWTGFHWRPQVIMNFRAMINELSLLSGGEYTVHFLVHVKNNDVPIWVSDEIYQQVLRENVPEEFWGLVTLWSEKQMELIYPGPYNDNFENPSQQPIHGAYRSLHMPLQYFAHQHPEYEFFWNWEMDMRYSGHYYELFDRMGAWGKAQSRKGLWERNAKYYIPGLHGSWENFTALVAEENKGNRAVFGPALFQGSTLVGQDEVVMPENCGNGAPQEQCGVGEEVDLITLNPIFDPNGTRWVFMSDVSGYSTDFPIPPRRVAIVTAGRLSKRLLNLMHEETYILKHSMFAEMWPPSVALHHGLKAIYAPHPVYFDRQWPLESIEEHFNAGLFGSTGGNSTSVFADYNEHNFQGTSWYYNSGFAGALWRRWLGHAENEEGGTLVEQKGSGRMCLRSTLVHPIKYETVKTHD